MVKEGIKRVLSVPLKSKGALHGIINVAGGDAKPFTARDMNLMSIIGNILGEAMAQAKAYQQLKQANIELSKLNEMKANFISMVTHELRTPLMAVKEGISACHAKITDPVLLNNCTFARISVERLLRLIDNLWSISNIEAGKVELNRKSVAVGTLVKTAVNLLDTLIRNKELTLSLDVPESLPFIFVDTDKILQIILNLLDNAIKFTSAGGQISIKACQINESFIEVSIADTGVGMSAEESAEIFSQIPALTENGLGKLGVIRLGLRICRLLIEMHGGKITVASESHKGSNFKLTLPILQATG
jgi:two-component system sensor histidine kinase ResE